MGLDIRVQSGVCAWREACVKKHTLRETALHCPDFSRDLSLPGEGEQKVAGPVHKRVEDVFGP